MNTIVKATVTAAAGLALLLFGAAQAAAEPASPGSIAGFDPQPDPPGEISSHRLNPPSGLSTPPALRPVIR